MELLLLLVALLGHAFLWIGLVNRIHSVGMRRKVLKTISWSCFLCMVAIPVAIGWWYVVGRPENWTFVIAAYAAICCVVAPVTLLRLVWLRWLQPTPSVVRFHRRRRIDIALDGDGSNGDSKHHWLAHLPLNEALHLEVNQWVLDVPRLSPTLDGLSILHLSDLHLIDRISKAYFQEVVRVCNELQPDLACITGDIVDRTECIDWIPDTLGRLKTRHGVYFILGNHDRRVDTGRLRRMLEQSGLVDLGGRWLSIAIDGTSVALAGNEQPWFKGSGTRPHSPGATAGRGLVIALAHSPDQFAWARAQNADLLLAGHTHGGQIRIPLLGAILSPTAAGVRYISGVYYVAPTILHVTQGISSDIPLRWNCRPEIAHLRLRAGGPS
jgi:uncharacterized protein